MAYAGPTTYLENLLFNQKNSLISQSLKATKSAYVTNGDGFGVAWYGKREKPGLFKDVLPAWNDENLREISQHIESNLFFAHVRAATGTSVSRANCHPYTYNNWSFMHNGVIGDWQINRRDIESMISKDLYHIRHGTTDSEALFLLALTEGLQTNPVAGMSKAVRKVMDVMKGNGSTNPLRISAALSDGKSIWAFRFSSDKQSPSLYYGIPDAHLHIDGNSVSTIASEPLDDGEDGHWAGVCEDSVLHWKDGLVSLNAFNPE
jgi:glutamine amidotransferase